MQHAILTLTTEGPSADSADGGELHRLRIAWLVTSTWNSLGAGVQVGLECLPTADVDSAGCVGAKSARSFDVATGVQAWVGCLR